LSLLLVPGLIFSQQQVRIKKSEFKTEQEEGFEEAWKNIKMGDKLYKAGKGTYRDAREHYLFAAKYNPENAELNYKIGACYVFADDKYESIKYLTRAFLADENVASDIRFLAGQAYHLMLEFDEAINQYGKYKESLEPKQLAAQRKTIDKLIEECENGKQLVTDPKRVIINNMGEQINSEGDDYNPIFAPNDTAIFFTSRRQHHEKAKRSPIDNKHYEDIYVASADGDEWMAARNMGKPVNSLNHNTAAVGLSPHGNQLYIYRGYKGGGGIYRSTLKEGKWGAPKNVHSKLRSKFRETTMSLSPDGKTFYFVSDNQKLTTGGKDIFFSEQDAAGKWKDPENIGSEINTPYNEEAVFISPDGNTLYFSSKGHNTMGGFDVFRSVRNDLGDWSPAENLGYPINSPDDDVFYKVTPDARFAFYSANRMGGYGGKDIYRIVFLGEEKEMLMSTEDILIAGILEESKTGFFAPPQEITLDTSYVLTGKVFDSQTLEGVMAKLDFIDVDISQVVATAVANDTGYYRAKLPEGKAYGIEIVATDYLFFLDIVDVSGEDSNEEIYRDFPLDKVEVGATVVLENIFFETNKATLKEESFAQLEQVLKFMNSNPTVRMEISGHTDNTGSLKLNTRLSQARAESVVDYLVEHGIGEGRLDAMGYAFSQPIATNDTAEGRAKNRRVEFKILSK
jgi:outer membrane protein OmpA-like peptidoglycan-associated protein/tetratricopeptide (TPR) repeat protein